ncbi:zinc metallochaperone AztD [Glutamicibacter ardleyensis]|uniref:zinc metallochaperone AztD n=1 Tax=Glutamicibacter ardleyensis TaxID=225894 RepID=UPI003FD17388
MKKKNHHLITGTVILTVLGLGATACGAQGDAAAEELTAPRVAVGYANGVSVLDGETLEVIKSFDTEEFTRLNSAGDGRNFLLTTSAGFQVLDAVTPALRQTVFGASAAGHVVPHAGKTALFDDGTGATTLFETAELSKSTDQLPETKTITSPAHHGVSVALDDGSVLTTIGDATARSGVRLVDAQGEETARNTDCPNVHGEGMTGQGRAVFGCEDGALIYADAKFTKLKAPDAYGRMGNAYVSPTSELVIGDYKDDPDAEGTLLDQIVLIDAAKQTSKVVGLPQGAEYTWRGIARGPQDLGYLLGMDGKIHVIDPRSGEITRDFKVIEPWEDPAQWQDPHPSLRIDGNTAYVADPATKSIHAVDLATGEKKSSVQLEHAPNEMALTTK